MGSRSRYFQIGTHAFGPLTFGTRRETLGLEGQEAAIQRIGILFWNVAKQNVEDRIARIATKFGAQIIVLAESEMMPHRLTHALRNGSGETFKYLNTQCKRLAIATSINPRFIEFRFEADRYSIFELKLPLTKSYLVNAAHGPSKLYWKQEDQAHFVRSLSASVRDVEKGVGHSRTIVIGDFNLDTFENPMVEAAGLNCVRVHSVAAKMGGVRKYAGDEYPYFYNPMWNFLGDETVHAPGTYFYGKGGAVKHYWHMFDQVLIRPGIRQNLVYDTLRIVEHDGEDSLITADGRPDAAKSDHLPITFKLKPDSEIP